MIRPLRPWIRLVWISVVAVLIVACGDGNAADEHKQLLISGQQALAQSKVREALESEKGGQVTFLGIEMDK